MSECINLERIMLSRLGCLMRSGNNQQIKILLVMSSLYIGYSSHKSY